MSKKIKDKTLEPLSLHVAGATVKHKGRFSELKVIENTEALSNEFIGKYVAPFYLSRNDTDKFRENYLEIRDSIDVALVSKKVSPAPVDVLSAVGTGASADPST